MKKKLALMLAMTLAIAMTTGFTYTDKMGSKGVMVSSQNHKVEVEKSLDFDPSGVKNMAVKNGVGEIELEESSSGKIEIEAEVTVGGPNKTILHTISADVGLKAEKTEETLEIAVVHKETGEYFWNWLNNNYASSKYSVGVSYKISVPKGTIESYTMDQNVGDIEVEDVAGAFTIRSNVGDIQLKNVSITGNSEFKLNIGEMKVHALSLTGTDTISASVNIGDIQFTLDKNVDATITAKSMLVKAQTDTLGAGTTKIDMSANIGSCKYITK